MAIGPGMVALGRLHCGTNGLASTCHSTRKSRAPSLFRIIFGPSFVLRSFRFYRSAPHQFISDLQQIKSYPKPLWRFTPRRSLIPYLRLG